MAEAANLLSIMVNVVLPTFLMASVGYLVRRFVGIDPRAVTRLSLYVLVPALVFNSMLTSTMAGDEILRVAAYAVLLNLCLVLLGMALARACGATRAEASGITLGVAFVNAANYGLPVALFAFGQAGFDRAVVFATFAMILTFSVAVFVAARGRADWRQALVSVLQLPVLWAAAIAVALRALGLELPTPFQRAVSILSTGAIPVVILLLGMQVAGMGMSQVRLPVVLATAGRLVVSPAIGLLLVGLLRPDPLTAKVLVMESAMPTAVNVALLAAEYDAEPALVSSIVLLTTALSVISLTVWVAYLQAL